MKQLQNTSFTLLTADNISTIVPLYCRVFNAEPWKDGWTEAVAFERLNTFAQFPTFLGVAILSDSEVQGFALGWAERWVNSWQFHLYEMCIDLKAQGQGHGRAVITEMERLVKERSYTEIFLKTSTDAPAKQFYEACGYQQRGMVVMGKRLV
jgi:aminoglycoside 6'-N-acetyltransferase I